MPFELPSDLGDIPRPLIAAALLAAPTLIWIGYRMWVGPRRRRGLEAPDAADYWLCSACASANPGWSPACYHCHRGRVVPSVAERAAGRPGHAPDQEVGVPVMGEVDAGTHGPDDHADRPTVGPRPAEPSLAPPVAPLPVIVGPSRITVVDAPPRSGRGSGELALAAPASDPRADDDPPAADMKEPGRSAVRAP